MDRGDPNRSHEPDAPQPAREPHTILLVEDDPCVRRVLQRMLNAAGFKVIPASGGDEALERISSEPGPIDLLLTDMMMPQMSGDELAEKVEEQRPGTRVLLMSGRPPDPGRMTRSSHPFLEKPMTSKELVEAVSGVLEGRL